VKIRALVISACCGLALVAPPAIPSNVAPAPVIPQASAADFSGIKNPKITPGTALAYPLPASVTSLQVTKGSDIATFSKTDEGKWQLSLTPNARPGTYPLTIHATVDGQDFEQSLELTVDPYSLVFDNDGFALAPGQMRGYTPGGFAPAGTKVTGGNEMVTIEHDPNSNSPAQVRVVVSPNAHPGDHEIPVTVTFPNGQEELYTIPLTVSERNITFLQKTNVHRGSSVSLTPGGYIEPWPSEASLEASTSDSSLTAMVEGNTVTVSATDDAPLGNNHSVTVFVFTPGQERQDRTVTVNVEPNEFFDVEEGYSVKTGGVFELSNLPLPEHAELSIEGSADVRVVQRTGKAPYLQLASNLKPGTYPVKLHIDYPGQPRVTKTLNLVVGDGTEPSTSPGTSPAPEPSPKPEPSPQPKPSPSPEPSPDPEPETPPTGVSFPSTVTMENGVAVIRPSRGSIRGENVQVATPSGWTHVVRGEVIEVTAARGVTTGNVRITVDGKNHYVSVKGQGGSGDAQGACVASPAGYALPLAWGIPLLALAAVHVPAPATPAPIAQYQEGLGEGVSGAIGALIALVAVVSAIGYGVGCYGQQAS